jgi:hypothetical protein
MLLHSYVRDCCDRVAVKTICFLLGAAKRAWYPPVYRITLKRRLQGPFVPYCCGPGLDPALLMLARMR